MDRSHMTITTEIRHFARHYAEMVVAMLLGMAVLWMPATLALQGLGMSSQELHDDGAAMLLVMATTMTVPMVAWMRYRGPRLARLARDGRLDVPADARRH